MRNLNRVSEGELRHTLRESPEFEARGGGGCVLADGLPHVRECEQAMDGQMIRVEAKIAEPGIENVPAPVGIVGFGIETIRPGGEQRDTGQRRRVPGFWGPDEFLAVDQ